MIKRRRASASIYLLLTTAGATGILAGVVAPDYAAPIGVIGTALIAVCGWIAKNWITAVNTNIGEVAGLKETIAEIKKWIEVHMAWATSQRSDVDRVADTNKLHLREIMDERRRADDIQWGNQNKWNDHNSITLDRIETKIDDISTRLAAGA